MAILEHYGYYDEPGQFPEHFHTSCELMYIHEGELELLSGGERYPLTGGMLYLIPSCIRHENRLIDRAVYRRTLIILNPWEYTRIHYSIRINDLLMGFTHRVPLVVRDDFGAAELLDRLGREYQSEDPQAPDIQAAVLTLILGEMLRRSGLTDRLRQAPDPLVLDIQRYIREHFSEDLVIGQVADRFYINKFYMSHIFKEQTGMSPRQYLNFTRLSGAYSLLHDLTMKISDIAEYCGFASPSDMTKRFREHYGLTPGDFRRELKKKKQK